MAPARALGSAQDDSGQDQNQSAQLLNGQHLSGDHRAEQYACHRIEQSDHSDGARGQVPQSGEPRSEGQRGGDQGATAEREGGR